MKKKRTDGRKTIEMIVWRWNPKEELWYEWKRGVVFCTVNTRNITVVRELNVFKFSLKDGEQVGSFSGQNPNYAYSVDLDRLRDYSPANTRFQPQRS